MHAVNQVRKKGLSILMVVLLTSTVFAPLIGGDEQKDDSTEHDLSVVELNVEKTKKPNEYYVNSTIKALGTKDERDVEVELLVDGKKVDNVTLPFVQGTENKIESSNNVTIKNGEVRNAGSYFGWSKRKCINISNSGSALTDYQIKIDVTYDSDMQNDFDDIRFTASDEKTNLSYWMEEYTDSSDVTFWVNVTNIPSSDSEIFMYYGNPSVSSTSNFDNTFTKDYGESGLVGLWHIDEGSGTTITDSSGNENTGNFKGAGEPAWVGSDGGQWNSREDIKFSSGNCLYFDGDDDYVDCGNNASLNIVDEITIMGWIKHTDIEGGSWFVTKYYKLANKRQYALCRSDSDTIRLYISDDGSFNSGHYSEIVGSTVLSEGQWHHFAATFKGSENTAIVYLNGIQDGIDSNTDISSIYTSNAKLIIGNREGFDVNYFNGTIDEIRIYNRALSAKEIKAHYERRKYSTSEPTINIGTEEDIGTKANLTTTKITTSPGSNWEELKVNKTEYGKGNNITVSVLDGTTKDVIGGFENLSSLEIDLSSISKISHPTLCLKANLNINETSPKSSILYDWYVTWKNATYEGVWGDTFQNTTKISFRWKATKVGIHNITVKIVTKAEETNTTNNWKKVDFNVIGEPEIEIEPNKIDLKIEKGKVVEKQINITNNGLGNLDFEIIEQKKDNFFDDFPLTTINSSNWASTVGTPLINRNGINEPSESYSLNLNGDADTITSVVFDLTGSENAEFSFHYELGGGGEAPDSGDWLFLEYYSSSSTWITLWSQEGLSTNNNTYDFAKVGLPTNVFHKNFQFQFRSTGSGAGYDDFFVDDLYFNYTTKSEWLSIIPLNGTLDPGNNTLINLTINATDLDPGKYYANITLETNDLLNKTIIIPITLHVFPAQHDIEIKEIEAPIWAKPNQEVQINATIINNGMNNETNIVINLTVDGILKNSTTIPFLEWSQNNSNKISLNFTPKSEGYTNITVSVSPVPSENIIDNNEQNKTVRIFIPLGNILVDYGHDCYVNYGNYDDFLDLLYQNKHIINTTTETITEELLSNYSAFLSIAASSSYSSSEETVIKNYVANNGGLLVIGGRMSYSYYNDLTYYSNITWQSPSGNSGSSTYIYEHEITKGISELYYGSPGDSLSVSNQAFVLVNDSNNQYIQAACSEYGNGKIVALMDEIWFDNNYLDNYDNKKFGINIINWLTETFRIDVDKETKYLNASESVKFEITVTNLGDRQDLFNLSHSTLPKGWSASFDKDNFTLTAGEEKTVNLTVTAPTDLGYVDISVVEIEAVSNNTKKSVAINVTAIIPPKVIVEPEGFDFKVEKGKIFNETLTIWNKGDGDLDFEIYGSSVAHLKPRILEFFSGDSKYAISHLDALNNGQGALEWEINYTVYDPNDISLLSQIEINSYDFMLFQGHDILESPNIDPLLANADKIRNFLSIPTKSLVIIWGYQDSGQMDLSSFLPSGNGNLVIDGNNNDNAVCLIQSEKSDHAILNNPNTISNTEIGNVWHYGPSREYYSSIPTGSESITYRDDIGPSGTTLFISHLSTRGRLIGAGYVIPDNYANSESGAAEEIILWENILYYIQQFYDTSWLSFYPNNGTINATITHNANESINLTINATDLNVGRYQTNLTLESNDPFNSIITIPINLTVLNPDHDIKVETLKAPKTVEATNMVYINATILNQGIYNETNIEIQLKIGNKTNKTSIIPNLDIANSTIVSFTWNPPIAGEYFIEIYAVPVENETIIYNNVLNTTINVIAEPDIWINQTSYDIAVKQGEIKELNLTIGNSGLAELDFDIFDDISIWKDSFSIIDESNALDWARFTSSDIKTKSNDLMSNSAYRSMIKLDIESIPNFVEITKAELFMYYYSTPAIHSIRLYRVSDDSWSYTSNSGSELHSWPVVSSEYVNYNTPSSNGWYALNITSLIHAEINSGDSILSIKWHCMSGGGNFAYLYSPSGTNPLYLQISYLTHQYDWLTESVDSGKVIPFNDTPVVVIVNTSRLNPGFHQANLTVSSNDPDESQLIIPVNLTVNQVPHEIKVKNLTAPESGEAGKSIKVNATILNQGLNNETNIEIQLKVDGIIKDNFTISNLTSGNETEIYLNWSPPIAGNYFIEIYAVPVENETINYNNVLNITINVTAEPDIWINQISFDIIAEQGELKEVNLTIGNDGLADLDFNIPLPTYQKNGQSITTQGDIDDTLSWDENGDGSDDIFDYMYIYAYSGDGDSLDVHVYAWDGSTWDTLYSDTNGGSRVVVDSSFENEDYSKVRIVMDDTEDNDDIYYQYDFNFKGAHEWLSWFPITGTVNPSNNTTVTLTINATELDPDYYQANLTITSNDLDESEIIIPVNLTVLVPGHDIRVKSIDAPSTAEAGKLVKVNTTIMNQGIENETNIEIQLKVDSIVKDNFTIPTLNSGNMQNVTFNWTPPIAGDYFFEIYAVPVIDENVTINNFLNTTINVTAEPDIWIDPPSFNITVKQGEVKEVNLTIENDGLANLEYFITGASGTNENKVIEVALYPSSTGSNVVATVLNTQPDINVTVISSYDSSTLSNYDVLMNIRGNDYNPTDVLDFISNGGAWVGEYTSNEYPISNWGIISGSIPSAAGSGSNSINIIDPEHYLATEIDWANIPIGSDPCDWMRDLRGISDPQAKTIITVNHNSYTNNPLFVEKLYGLGKILIFNWDYRDDPDYNTYVEDMIQEAVRYASFKAGIGCNWLSISPDNGTITPFGEMNITLTFNTSHLDPGFYQSNLTISSNDPDESQLIIPVNLTVNQVDHEIKVKNLSAPKNGEAGKIIKVNATILNQGLNNETNIEIQLKVDGSVKDNFTISNLTSGNETEINLNWTPPIAGEYFIEVYTVPVSGETIVYNNVLNSTINVTAEPDIWIEPTSFDIVVEQGEINEVNLTIGNDGLADLNFDIADDVIKGVTNEEEFGSWSSTHSGGNRARGNYFYVAVDTILVEQLFRLDISTTDLYFYVFESSTRTGTYTKISEVIKTGISGGTNWYSSGTLNIILESGKYYLVCTAWESSVGYAYGSGTFSCSFGTHEGSFGVNNCPLTTTIDDDPNNGQAYFQKLITTTGSGIDWLTGIPPYGTVNPGNNTIVTLTINATELDPDYYQANITITSNDLDESEIIIPVNLTVLVPGHDIRVKSIDVPKNAEAGKLVKVNTTIMNQGTENETNIEIQLKVDSVVKDNFTIPTLNSGNMQNITFNWTPPIAGDYFIEIYAVPVVDENVTINNVLNTTINVTAEPDIWVNPTSFDISVEQGERKEVNLTIRNDGLADLECFITSDIQKESGIDMFPVSTSIGADKLDNIDHTIGEEYSVAPDDYRADSSGTSFTADFQFGKWNIDTAKMIVRGCPNNGGPANIYFKIGGITIGQTTLGDGSSQVFSEASATLETSHFTSDSTNVITVSHTNSAGYFVYDFLELNLTFSMASTGKWLRVSPKSTTVCPGNNTNITVTINTTTLNPGFYQANLTITSNDLDESEIIIPVNLTVLVPGHDIKVKSIDAPSSAEAGKIVKVNATIMNQGIENETNIEIQLKVDSIVKDNFIIPTLNSGNMQNITLNWTPPITGDYFIEIYAVPVVDENVTINNVLNTTINVTAEPDIWIDPTSFNTTIKQGEIKEVNLNIGNDGLADLEYFITGASGTKENEVIEVALYPSSSDSTLVAAVLNKQPDINATVISSYDSSTLSNYDVLMNIRGNDYNPADVLNFISNGGAWVGEWKSNEYPITNWGVIFGSIPGVNNDGSNSVNIIDPEHYLATEIDWANIPVGSDPCDHMYDLRGISDPQAKTIITVNHDNYPNNPLFVEKLYGKGKVLIFNWDYSDEPDYNTYVEDMIQEAVRYASFNLGRDCSWLSVSSNNGTITPYGDVNVTLTFNASDLYPGFYQANLTISNNDPNEGTIVVPVNLTVNQVAPEIKVKNITAPESGEAGKSIKINATILNQGLNNETNIEIQLKVDGLIKDNFTISNLTSGNETVIYLNWTPPIAGEYFIEIYSIPVPGETIVYNNVLNSTINVTAEPDIWIEPTSYDIAVEQGEIKEMNLTIGNDGLAGLDYDIPLPTYQKNGQSITTQGDIDDTLSWDENGDGSDDIFDYMYIYAYSGDSDSLDVYIYAWDGSTWDTLYSDTNGGSRVVVDSSFENEDYSKVRIVMDDTEDNDDIYYQYDFNFKGAHEWLTWFPIAGRVNPSNNTIVTLTINATELDPDYYQANITITSNDLDESEIIIPVNLTILVPGHDIRVKSIDAPKNAEAGKLVKVNTTIMNQGIENETNIEIQLKVDSIVKDNFTIPTLKSGNMQIVTLNWTPPIAGDYFIEIYSVPVVDENVTINNFLNTTINVTAEPDIWIDPTSFDIALEQSEIKEFNLTIGNDGLDDLDFIISDDIISGITNEEEFGSWSDIYSGENRARGNVFYVTIDTILVEQLFQLSLDGVTLTSLYYYVFESDTKTGTYNIISEVIKSYIGIISPRWYSSGFINVPLKSGKYYIICIAWESSVGYARGSGIYPCSFGTHEGSWVNNNYPLGSEVDVSSIGNNAYYQKLITSTESEIEWLTEMPILGIVNPGNNTTITLTINATELEPDYYQTNLTITSNDPDESKIIIPVNLTVLVPGHDIRVKTIDVPENAEVGKIVKVNATILNQGINHETNIEIQLKVDNVVKDTFTIPVLNSGNLQNVTFNWTPPFGGEYLIEIFAVPVIGETHIYNNVLNTTIDVFADPKIWINPTSFDITLEQGEIKELDLTIGNDGLADLDYDITDDVFGMGSPVTEIFSDSSDYGTSYTEKKCNAYYVSIDVKLTDFEVYFNNSATTTLTFMLYEGNSLSGTYTKIHESSKVFPISSASFKSIGSINIDLSAGIYYITVFTFSNSATYYYNGTPDLKTCSFGKLEGGDNEDVSLGETHNFSPRTSIAYYERLTTKLKTGVSDDWLTEFPTSGIVYPCGNTTITITINTSNLDVGKYYSNLSITNNDPNNSIMTIPLNFTIVKPNRPPFISPKIPNIIMDEDNSSAYILYLNHYGHDIEELSSELKWSVSFTDKSLITATIDGKNQLGIKPLADKFGKTIITLTVRDSKGKTTSQVITVTISSINDPPKITPKISDIVLEENNKTYILDLSLHEFDVDDSKENLKWSISGVIDTLLEVKIEDKKLKITPKPDKNGVNTITLQLKDGAGEIAEQKVKITVLKENILPIANAGKNMAVKVGETVQFNGIGSDKDGIIVKYEWDFDGDGIYDWSSNTTGSTSHRYIKSGKYQATLRVTDNRGGNSTSSIQITVKDDGDNKILGINKPIFALLILFLIIGFVGGTIYFMKYNNKESKIKNTEVRRVGMQAEYKNLNYESFKPTPVKLWGKPQIKPEPPVFKPVVKPDEKEEKMDEKPKDIWKPKKVEQTQVKEEVKETSVGLTSLKEEKVEEPKADIQQTSEEKETIEELEEEIWKTKKVEEPKTDTQQISEEKETTKETDEDDWWKNWEKRMKSNNLKGK